MHFTNMHVGNDNDKALINCKKGELTLFTNSFLELHTIDMSEAHVSAK